MCSPLSSARARSSAQPAPVLRPIRRLRASSKAPPAHRRETGEFDGSWNTSPFRCRVYDARAAPSSQCTARGDCGYVAPDFLGTRGYACLLRVAPLNYSRRLVRDSQFLAILHGKRRKDGDGDCLTARRWWRPRAWSQAVHRDRTPRRRAPLRPTRSTTGEEYVRIPVPSPEVLNGALRTIGRLLHRFRR